MNPHLPDPSTHPRTGRRARALRSTAAKLHVAISRDPFTVSYVMSVGGLVNATTIATLAIALASVEDHSGLHVDVTDATVETPEIMRRLETLIDDLERRGVRLRMVGFGPQLPAI
jgi:hypothetical protein